MQRQNEGYLPPFPIWDDVCTFDGHPWRGVVDVVSGGFPCQDISAAGTGAGLDGARSGLWVEMARIISEVRPTFCFVENSPVLTSRGLGRVLGDLAGMGYDAEWGVLGAADVGAPHQRDRIWIVAYTAGLDCNAWRTESAGQQRQTWAANGGDDVADSTSARLDIGTREEGRPLWNETRGPQSERRGGGLNGTTNWSIEPAVGRVAHGVAHRVDRLRAIGNGQVPQCAAEAWLRLSARFGF
jgi:DNA (cytosine-5)-methyltransferase 1